MKTAGQDVQDFFSAVNKQAFSSSSLSSFFFVVVVVDGVELAIIIPPPRFPRDENIVPFASLPQPVFGAELSCFYFAVVFALYMESSLSLVCLLLLLLPFFFVLVVYRLSLFRTEFCIGEKEDIM
jgi:hypothetical protein